MKFYAAALLAINATAMKIRQDIKSFDLAQLAAAVG
jgi:hypothetical protein